MKDYLLIAGYQYYPEAGTRDWIGCFFSYKEALSQVEPVKHTRTVSKGKRKGEEVLEYTTYKINGKEHDWYKIVDLAEWIFAKDKETE